MKVAHTLESPEEPDEILSSLPPGLDGFFERMINNILPDFRKDAARIFLVRLQSTRFSVSPWHVMYCCGSNQTLELERLVSGSEPFVAQDLNVIQQRGERFVDIRCHDILRVDYELEPAFGNLEFVHRTTYDVLARDETLRTLKDWAGPFEPLYELNKAMFKCYEHIGRAKTSPGPEGEELERRIRDGWRESDTWESNIRLRNEGLENLADDALHRWTGMSDSEKFEKAITYNLGTFILKALRKERDLSAINSDQILTDCWLMDLGPGPSLRPFKDKLKLTHFLLDHCDNTLETWNTFVIVLSFTSENYEHIEEVLDIVEEIFTAFVERGASLDEQLVIELYGIGTITAIERITQVLGTRRSERIRAAAQAYEKDQMARRQFESMSRYFS